MAMGNPHSALGASVFVLTAAITFATYTSTASRSIAGGDSGELVAEGCTLGTAHPPGYPLYTIIVYLVTTLGKQWFPTIPPAYLVNLTSCMFGSISSGLISLVVWQLTNGGSHTQAAQAQLCPSTVSRFSAALSAGLVCSFSPLMWQYNTSAEVFALHNLFVSLILYVLAIYSFRPDSTFIIAVGSFISGLALTNQHTSILLISPVAAWVCYTSSLLTKPRLLLLSSISFVSGISLYALLPLLAINYPHAGSWGDITTVSGFIHHFLRRDYGTLQLYSGSDSASEGMIERTLSWAVDFAFNQLGYLTLPFFIPLIGLATRVQLCYKEKRKTKKRGQHKFVPSKSGNDCSSAVWKMILSALIFYLGVFHSLSNLPLSNPLHYGIHQRFWMHPNILCFVLFGITMEKSMIIASKSRLTRVCVLAGMVLLFPLDAYRRSYPISDQSANNYFKKYALSILETLPENSLLLSNYDQQWTSIRYMQECEGVRPDVTSINLSMMTFEWWAAKRELYDNVNFPGTHYTMGNTLPWRNGGFTFSEFVDANVKHFGLNIFIGGRLNFDDSTFNEKYDEQPFGLVRRIHRASALDSGAERYRTHSLHVWRNIAKHLASDLPDAHKYPESTWESTIVKEFFDHLVSRSTYLLDLALRENDNSAQAVKSRVLPSIVEAAAWLELASSWDKRLLQQSSMKKNLGLAYMNMVRSKETGRFPYVEDIFDGGGNETRTEKNGLEIEHRHNWWTEDSQNGHGNWKEWATTQWQKEWEAFLGLEASKSDPSYAQIEKIYETVMNSARAKSA